MLICWILFIFKSIFFKAEILTPFAKYYLQTIIQVIKKYEFIIQASWFETHHFSDHWSDVHFATKFWAYNWFSFSLVSPHLHWSSQFLPDGARTLLRKRECGGLPPPSGVEVLKKWKKRRELQHIFLSHSELNVVTFH